MVKVYNVWLQGEEIDGVHDNNGNDISCIKLGKFKTEKDAIRFDDAVIKMAIAVVKMFPGRINERLRKEPKVLYASCSEAVMRFYTTDPKKMQKILQAIKDEIVSKYPVENLSWLNPSKKIPLLAKAEMYDTGWNGELTYHGDVRKKYDKLINENRKKRDEGLISKKQALELNDKIKAKMNKEIYPNTILKACAGLGDNEAVITVEKGAFVLNIGNNDIQPGVDDTTYVDSELNKRTIDKTNAGPRYERARKKDWVELVMDMGLRVQEAERSEDLHDRRRDCCCGVTFFDGYDLRIEDPDFGELLQKAGLDVDLHLPYSIEENGKNVENPECKSVEELLEVFKIWRAGKRIPPHLTTIEHAKQFLSEPFAPDTIETIKKSGRHRLLEDIETDVQNLEKQRKKLIEKYKPRKTEKKSRAFVVNSKDLFDKKKNPNLVLSAEAVEKNKKIPKKYL